MSEVERALSQLAFIQDRLVASTRFRGLAPHAVAATGALAVVVAAAETIWPELGWPFVVTWVTTALAAVSFIGIEALERARRLHAGMADMMLAGTLRLLLPFGAAGAVITLVVARAAPEVTWILPGLWQMLIALIGFAAIGTLPRTIVWPASWYFLSGTATLLFAAKAGAPSPWMMGLPFGGGQAIVAIVLHHAGASDGGR